nr:nucleotidyltransferase family protein [uncultured Psychroserpens sp.]
MFTFESYFTDNLQSNKNTYRDTLQLIANILSFDHAIEDLKFKISNTEINWEEFVTVASNHLVLPACYYRLKQKNLLEYIPQDLESYLKEIALINKHRNLSLIKQSQDIASLFNTHNIDYVFLKGIALLFGNYYEDLGERMVGDIDLLINENQIDEAFNLLIKHGYTKMPVTLRDTFFDHRHKERLMLNDGLAAVELHSHLLNLELELLASETVLHEKQYVEKIPIPHSKDLFIHNILSHQINDKAHYYTQFSFRSSYDTLTLLKRSSKLLKHYDIKYVTSYFSINSIFFKVFNAAVLNKSYIKKFETRLNSPLLGSFHKKRLKFTESFNQITIRIIVFVKDKNYRIAVYKDRHRLFRELKTKLLNH